MSYKLRFSQYNERSILIEWPAIIEESILENILNFRKLIEGYYIKENIEVIATYNSILVVYSVTIDDVNSVFLTLKSLYNNQSEFRNRKSSIWNIPVCYDAEFGMDLETFSVHKKLKSSEIIKLHSQVVYTVFFIGFLPGFLYLGGLDSRLHLDRKTTPNLNVNKGSVGIGGKQTGIYPQNSPGGWHIIGNSPIELFNPKQKPPCFIKPGDHVKFHSISKSEHLKIQDKIKKATFNLQSLLIDSTND